jgi:hypothetical protein
MTILQIYKLAQSFLDNVNSNIYYHGGKEITDISSLKYDRDRSSADLNAEGPGFYLTSDLSEAETYGDVVYKTILPDSLNLITNEKPKLSILKRFYKLASDDRKYIFLSNYGENVSPDFVLKQYVKEDLLIDSLILLYHDLLQYNSKEFVDIMIKLGYDGYKVDKNKGTHVIMYNVSVLDLEKI